ncbi:MAG: MobF family relaxase, partial [Solirubrobacteraceae bacterium]
IEAPGRWAGGADQFGLDPEQPVTGEQLRTLMAVRRPDSGEELRRIGGSGEAVAAIDATFSAPKSVSAVWALANPALRQEIERAIDAALEYSLEQVAMIRQRVDSRTVIHAKPIGLVATSWRHTTARAVAGATPDPQLHSHVLLHAAVRRDGKVVAIDSRSWLVHRRELGAAYRTELARGLHELGFEIARETGRGGRYFEIAGIPGSLIDRWSTRHQQVQAAIAQRFTEQHAALQKVAAAGGPDAPEAIRRLELLARYGQLAPREERFMSASTRTAKGPATVRDLDDHWRDAAAAHQVDRDGVQRLRQARPGLQCADRERLLDGLTEFDATFPARDARAVALERSAGVAIPDVMQGLRELRGDHEILVLADGSGTTRAHRHREQATITTARQLAAGTTTALPEPIVAQQIQRLDHELSTRGGRLADEQRDAIRLACGEQPLVMIEGQAGTGKSTVLTGIARAHQACDRELIVTSTAAVAAQRLASELSAAGVDASAYSTAALHSAISARRLMLGPDSTVIHDEAALASTTEQHQLLTHVNHAGARLIMVGDPEQSQPVGAGGLWHHLQGTVNQRHARVQLTRNQRAQRPEDRRDQARFRHCEHELAVRGYAARDRVHLASDHQQAEATALHAAHTDQRAGLDTLVIAQTS